MDLESPFKTSPFVALIFIPFFLLFFKNALENRGTSIRDLTHLILPFFLLLLNKLQILNDLFNKIIFLSFTVIYWLFMIKIIIKYYRKTVIRFSFNKIIFRWLILMFTNATLVSFFLNYHVIYWQIDQSDMSLTDFYRGSSIVWVICLVYIILNPVVIFGKDYLLYQLNTKSKIYDPWKYKPLKTLQNMDTSINNKLIKSIPDLIFSLKSFEQDFNFLNSKELSLKTLSEKLKIPNSHLKFIIKYYNTLTVHEYFNLLKISFSIKLIQQGFLHQHTIESLSKASHFESRITFFNNFKKFTGKSPSKFINN
jgi:AraC-like DNA-binding protein